MYEENALSTVVAAAAGVVETCSSRCSRLVEEETYVINVYVHLLSDLPNCRFLSIQHLD